MISIRKHAVQLFLLSIISMVLWGCGGGTPSIKNGEPITGLSGTLDTVKTYKISIPENTVGLMIQLHGSSDIQAELFNSDDESVLICLPHSACVLSSPSSGSYVLKLTATGDYDNVTLAATWGGPAESVLANAVPVAELESPDQSVRLVSLFVASDKPSLSLQSNNMGDSVMQLLDFQAQVILDCVISCQTDGVLPGLYFIRIENTSAYADASLVASWGTPLTGSLENGMPKRALSADQGERIQETLYFPEQADSLMLVSSSQSVAWEIADQENNVVAQCTAGMPCVVSGLEEGLYSVWLTLLDAESDFSVTAAWGGVDMTSLHNRTQRQWDTAVNEDNFLDIFIIPDDVEFVAVTPLSLGVEQHVFNSQGVQVGECIWGDACILSHPVAGLYFVKSHYSGADGEQFHLALNYGGINYSSLDRRETKHNVAVPKSGVVIETFSVSAEDRLAAFSTAFGNRFAIYTENNRKLDCSSQAVCDLDLDGTDAFIAYIWPNDPEDDTISMGFATWTEEGGSIQNQDYFELELTTAIDMGAETFTATGDVDAFMITGPNEFSGSLFEISIYQMENREFVQSCVDVRVCIIKNEGTHDYLVLYFNPTTDQEVIQDRWSLTFGGDNYATISNGGLNVYDSLQVGDHVAESIWLPDFTEKMRFVSAYSGMVDLYDAEGNRLCRDGYECIVMPDQTNILFARVTKMDDLGPYFSTAMAYGVDGIGTLVSGDRRTNRVPENVSSLVEAFYVPEGIQSGVFAANSLSHKVDVYITDADGNRICLANGSCAFSQLQPGLYFVDLLTPSLPPWESDVEINYSLLLSGPEDVTLTGSGSFYDLNLEAGGVYLSSFYLADETASFSVASNSASGFRLFDSYGNEYPLGGVASGLMEGVYFLQFVSMEEDINNPMGYAVAFSGEENATIARGLPSEFPLFMDGRTDIQSFYLPVAAESILLMPPSRNEIITIQYSQGNENRLVDCVFVVPCVVENAEAGTYFVHTVLNGASSSTDDTYSLTMQYVGPNAGASMENGQMVSAEDIDLGQYWVQSFYIEAYSPAAFAASLELSVELLDTDGSDAEFFREVNNTVYSHTAFAGGYYAVMQNNGDTRGTLNAKALWGETPTLSNGSLVLTRGHDLVLESFYVEDNDPTDAFDFYAGMAFSNGTGMLLNVINSASAAPCDTGSSSFPCWFDLYDPGLNFLSAQAPALETSPADGIALAWGNPGIVAESSLINGQLYQIPDFEAALSVLHSVSLLEESVVTVEASGSLQFIAWEPYSRTPVASCESPCELTLEPGLKFIQLQFWGPSAGETYQVFW